MGIALGDAEIPALIARFQFPIQPQFQTQSLAPHDGLCLSALDLIALAIPGKREVVGDDALLDVAQNRGQLQRLGQRAMLVGKILNGAGEIRIPFRPIFLLQKRVGCCQSGDLGQP